MCRLAQLILALEEKPELSNLGFEVLTTVNIKIESRDSSVGTVTRLRARRPRNRGSIAGRGRKFLCRPNVQTGSGA